MKIQECHQLLVWDLSIVIGGLSQIGISCVGRIAQKITSKSPQPPFAKGGARRGLTLSTRTLHG